MSLIDDYLGHIASKRWARDVRTAIVNAIRQCYNDVNSPTLRETAFYNAITSAVTNNVLTGLGLGDGDVKTAKIDDLAVTTAKIANSAVTTEKVADGAITQEKLDPTIEFVEVDDQLETTGAAADAKATGDAISELNGSLDDIAADVEDSADWELVGTTNMMYPHHSARLVKIEADASTTITLNGVTIWDLDHLSGETYSNIEPVGDYTGPGHKYRITALGANVSTYRIIGKVTGLKIGKSYRICLKVTDPQNNKSGGGHYVQVYCKVAVRSFDGLHFPEQVFSSTFTATATSHDIYIQPFMTNNAGGYTPAVGDEFFIDDIYINEIGESDLYTHEMVFNQTITGTKLKHNVSGGMFIAESGTTGASVYIVGEAGKILTINGESPDAGGDITVKSRLQGKVMVGFGDSVAGKGKKEYTDCYYYVGKYTGMTVINAALGGTALHWRNNPRWDTVGFCSLVDMIVSGDWSAMTALGADTSFEIYSHVAQLAPILSAIDWNDVDYICINYGGNDISTDPYYSIIDDPTNHYNKSTYLGAFRYAIEKLLTAYPHLRVLVTTAVFRWWRVDEVRVTSDERLMASDKYYYEWGDALMECAQNEYHFPVLDIYRNLGVNKMNLDYYSEDGAHPEDVILERMGSLIAGAFMSKF